ncbi:Anti-sigma regulatory factor (Ser/Thr protein kinase) [Streptomyces sp. 2131.1]|uniref:ATP-binding protein n=1 Tax=Streptomyces sp. 2131.1 TaxID=1855346 RepID=UPI0008962FDB|nr:ATP-binding protein [Streptomyces sp. 2131.1]SED08491.1 Anti-sigma regulatory factor (Ser/Thr protein kinase) [Streptomyces sp. 2131.1]
MPQATTRARPTGPPGYSQTLPRRPESAAVARRLAETALCCWGLGELADDGALIVGELVANAVLHARRGSIRVVVERVTERTVRVAVTDFARELPVECRPGDGDEGGRGLLLVAALASDWGTDTRRWGKVVWADLEGRG